MSTGYQIKDQEGLYFLTFQVVDWVDIFTRQIYRDILIDSFKYSIENKNLQIFAYVVMSNHVHLIVQSTAGILSSTIGDIKKFTSKKIIETILDISESRRDWMFNRFYFNAGKHSRNKNHQFWTHENHAISLHSPEFIAEKLEYIHKNPVRAGIVTTPEDYLYSSARNYSGLDNLLEIELLIIPAKSI